MGFLLLLCCIINQNKLISITGTKGEIGDIGFKGEVGDRGFPGLKGTEEQNTKGYHERC